VRRKSGRHHLQAENMDPEGRLGEKIAGLQEAVLNSQRNKLVLWFL
jgi:hypothetical protein